MDYKVSDKTKQARQLPDDVLSETTFYADMDKVKYAVIADRLGIEPIIAALLDNLGVLFGRHHLSVNDKVTEIIGDFVDIVPAEEANLKGYCDIAYKVKPKFEKHFEVSDEKMADLRNLAHKRIKELLRK